MRKFITGAGALLALAALLVGIPAALIALAGNPIPTLDQLQAGLLLPDLGGRFLFQHVIPIAIWIAWATFAAGFLLELPAQLRGISRPRIPGLGLQQATMGALVAAVIVMLASGGAGIVATSAATPDAESKPSVTTSESADADVRERAQYQLPQAPGTAQAEADVDQVVVESGDTMWEIAEEELGAGERYTEIFDATTGQEQPVGGPIVDADLIYPGQVLNLPGEGTTVPVDAPAVPAATETPESVQDEPEVVPAPESGAQGADEADVDAGSTAAVPKTGSSGAVPAEQAAQAAADDAPAGDQGEDSGFLVPAMTAGGIGGLLASGLLVTIGLMRLRRRRLRRPGERFPHQELDTISDIELELRSVETPATMEAVDRTLRFLGQWAQQRQQPLPEIYALRNAAAELSLYLADGIELPAPFVRATEDGTSWAVDADQVPDIDEHVATPYPALVTLGRDETGAFVMVDLEYLGALALHGSESKTTAAMTALALELATSSWGSGLQVTLVGIADDLPPALTTSRLRHTADIDTLLEQLRRQADATRNELAGSGYATTTQARTSEADTDLWAPEIILLGQAPEQNVLAELQALVEQLPRVGIAVVSTERISGDWTLTIDADDRGILEPLGLPLAPQMVSDEEYRALRERCTELEQPAAPAPHGFTATTEHDRPASGHLRVVDEPVIDEEEVFAVARELAPQHEGAYLRVLGPVSVTGHADVTAGARPPVAMYTQMTALLALHPEGRSVEQLHAAIWPGEFHGDERASKRRNERTAETRRWLGQAPDGEHYMPARGSGAPFKIAQLHSDWEDFQRLARLDDLGSTGTAELLAALNLVEGVPFQGVRARTYIWRSDLTEEMIAAISDVAYELAQRGLEAGNLKLARFAVRVGRMVDPTAEIHWRTTFRIEDHAHNQAALEAAVSEFFRELEDYEAGTEPEAETQALIDTLHQRGVLSA